MLAAIWEVDAEGRAECHVKKLRWYNEPKKTSEHEFIVAELTESVYLRVERRPPSNVYQLRIISTSSSLDKAINAEDEIKMFTTSRELKDGVSSRSAEIVTELTFSSFPVLEFSRLLLAISDNRPN